MPRESAWAVKPQLGQFSKGAFLLTWPGKKNEEAVGSRSRVLSRLSRVESIGRRDNLKSSSNRDFETSILIRPLCGLLDKFIRTLTTMTTLFHLPSAP